MSVVVRRINTPAHGQQRSTRTPSSKLQTYVDGSFLAFLNLNCKKNLSLVDGGDILSQKHYFQTQISIFLHEKLVIETSGLYVFFQNVANMLKKF